MKTSHILPLLPALALVASAAVPHDWAVDLARPPTVEDVPVLRGETIDLSCAVLSGGRPYDLSGCSATLHWQTNGMPEETWWSAPASATGNVLRATWHPAMDPGVSPVSAFIGARNPRTGEIAYRAIMRLRILPAPGATPNELPIPPRRIDFATVEVANAPWIESETDPTVPAWAKAATPPLTEEIDPIASAWIAAHTDGRGKVSRADSADSAARADSADSADYSSFASGADNANQAFALFPARGSYAGEPSRSASEIFAALDAAVTAERDPVFSAWATNNNSWFRGKADTLRGDLPALPNLQVSDIMNADNQLQWATIRAALAATNYTDAAARAATNYTDAAVAAERMFVTNYYAISSLGRIYVTTNDYLFVESRNSVTSDWQYAWSSRAVQTNVDAVAARQDAVELTVAGAVSAWADYDAQGNPNPDPDVISLNRAYTAIGSGFFWASSGGYHCLCSSGTVAYLTDADGSLRIFGNSISNYIGLVAGGSVTVGANASSFAVTGDGANAVATIAYPYSSGGHPTIWGAATLAGPWAEMSGCVWIDDQHSGTSVVSFPATANSFFFKATTTMQLSEYFHATVPSYLEGGVKTSAGDIDPVIYDSVVEITSGGHTYRLPAQLVQ